MKLENLITKLTAYQYLTIFLITLAVASAFFYGFGPKSLVPVLIAVASASLTSMIIKYAKTRQIKFPKCAFISGLFIGGLLTQNLEWYVYATAGILAILSKKIIKVHGRHIFNPANFGVLAVSLIFPNAIDSWWVSSPMILVLVFGIFIVWYMQRFDLTLSFLITYFLINLIIELSKGNSLGDFYLMLINSNVIFFFAMFMLIEPKTHPAAKKQKIFYGFLVAIMLIGLEQGNSSYGLVFVLAVANLFVPFLNRLSFEMRKKSAEKLNAE